MSRLLSAAPAALVVFVVILALAALAIRVGFIPDDGVMLWGGAIMAGDGEMSIGRIVAAYPTLPFMMTTLADIVAPAGTPTPALLAAGLLGLIGGIWFLSFRDAGLSLAVAGTLTLFLIFHPALLRAAIAGPAEMFLVVFLYLFASSLFALRARSGVPEVMRIGAALLGLTFSHPMGAAIAFASMPFLIFAIQPMLIAGSALNVVLVLVFPAVFAVGSFVYVSWVFPGSGWTFFAAPAESLSAWIAGMSTTGLTGIPAIEAGLAIAVALVLAAPLVPVAIVWVFRRRPLVSPAVVFAVTIVTAAVMTVGTGFFGDPASLAVAGPVFAAIVITRVPVARERLAVVVPLVMVGWFGGAIALTIIDPRTVGHVVALLEGRSDRERLDALALGGATSERQGVLVDTVNAPAVVLGRGSARGLLAPSHETFKLSLLFSRIDTPFVAVPNPQAVTGAQDRLNRAFPLLYRNGVHGYRLIYQNQSWRLFERETRLPSPRLPQPTLVKSSETGE
jgi:hypothetical protein